MSPGGGIPAGSAQAHCQAEPAWVGIWEKNQF